MIPGFDRNTDIRSDTFILSGSPSDMRMKNAGFLQYMIAILRKNEILRVLLIFFHFLSADFFSLEIDADSRMMVRVIS